MHTGMLWFDNSKAAINVKVQAARTYYIKKYGRTPDLVLVHPSMMPADNDPVLIALALLSVTVRPYRPVMPGHIWIGIEDPPATQRSVKHES